MSSDVLKSVPFPIPTLDKPFGVELWPIFEQAYTKIMGYPPSAFYFVPGQTPLSTFKVTATLLATYYVVVLGGREFMRHRKAFRLNGFFMAHNLFLTVASAIMLALFIEQLVPTMNYITKYIELFDTGFLVLKKKPLSMQIPIRIEREQDFGANSALPAFLHTYHHGATALLCYTQLIGLTSVSWVPITLNLLVHVVMYWYYFQSARGVRIWWKEWITRLQIIQFVIDLGFVYFASYTYFSSTYFPHLPTFGKCAGEEFAAFAGIGILSSYLLLFISFYLATYKKSAGPHGRKRSMSEMGKKAAIDMSKLEVPTVEDAIHVGAAATAGKNENGGVVGANGALNGSMSTRSMRTRRA
ncbi:MAG: hypothetical protein Q9219_004586 [cf. Caloplaca sp. 3 TL-2023]